MGNNRNKNKKRRGWHYNTYCCKQYNKMMLLNFFFLSIIVGIASANPVALSSQLHNDVIDYSTDFKYVRENPFPLLQRNGDLTGYQKSVLSTATDIIYWLLSNFSYIITAAAISFCRLSNVCMGMEQYVPVITNMVSQALTPENRGMAERVLVTVMGKYFDGRE